MISRDEFQKGIEEMIHAAATKLPRDVTKELNRAKNREQNQLAEIQLKTILKNVDIAREKGLPICQDTGLPIFFIRMGKKINLKFDLEKVLRKAVRKSTKTVPLRPNVVDPISRENSDDNTGERQPCSHLQFQNGRKLVIDLMLKGAGSENWSQLFMLNPVTTREGIRKRVLKMIKEAGGQICPPCIVGIGLGGTADQACTLAKKALLRALGKSSTDKDLEKLEDEITESANQLNVGPMGLGGKTTVLDTHILKAGCHTASLPLAINFQCWAARRAKSRLSKGELVLEIPK